MSLTSKVQALALAIIVPSALNPRKSFPGIEDLANDIQLFGVQQPITVRPAPATQSEAQFEIICGERRFRACQMLGLETIPAIVREASDADVVDLALSENLQRANLSPIETALGLQSLLTLNPGLTQESIAAKHRIKGGDSRVSNLIRLLSLPESVQSALSAGKITEGHGTALCSLEGHQSVQVVLCAQTIENDWTVAQLREAVKIKREQLRQAEQSIPLPLDESDEGSAGKSVASPKPSPDPKPASDPKPAPKDDNGLTRKESDKQFAESQKPDPDVTKLSDLAEQARAEAEVPQTQTVATQAQTEATQAEAQEAPAPAPVAEAGRVTTTIRAEDDDWLFEQALTIDQAMDLARAAKAPQGVELTEMAIKCIKAIADEYRSRTGEEETESAILESILRVRAKQAGCNLETLAENPL